MTYSEVVEYVKIEVRVTKHKRNWWREVPSERGKAHNAVPYLARARSTNTLYITTSSRMSSLVTCHDH